MRSLKSDNTGWMSIFTIVLLFVSFLMVSSYFLTGDDPFKEFGDDFFNSTVNPEKEAWKFDILNPIYSVVDLVLLRPLETVVNAFSEIGNLMFNLIWQFISLDIPILNALGFIGFSIKIVIWVIYGMVILQLLPFVG